jgi:protease-4
VLRNQVRRLREAPDYIVLPVGGPLPQRMAPPRSFVQRQLGLPPPPLSMERLAHTLRRIGEDERVQGVVIVLRGLETGPATLWSLRRLLQRVRKQGKRVIVYTTRLEWAEYYVGTSADLLVIPPATSFDVLGLQLSVRYYRDALAALGLKADVVRISPYKSAGNPFSEATMTAEEQAQYNWLLDESWHHFTDTMAADRGIAPETLHGLINWAPFSAAEALRNGLVDAVAYQDELPRLIRATWPPDRSASDQDNPLPRLQTTGQALPALTERPRRRHHRAIGVIGITGMIMLDTPSSPLPLPVPGNGPVAAEADLSRRLRHAAADDTIAALVLVIDSPGGDALASDLIWREICNVRRKKPVVAWMSSVAASGGYYVAAAANRIVATPTTITGSIGVIMARLSMSGLYDKLHINEQTLHRGNRAGLYRDSHPLSDSERAVVWGQVLDIYGRFCQIVAEGRNLSPEAVDAIGGGRVWSGRQALENGLVDSLGDFGTAVALACKLANLPTPDRAEVPVRTIHTIEGYSLPAATPMEEGNRENGRGSADFSALAASLLPPWMRTARHIAALWPALAGGRPLCLMPWEITLT